MSARGSAPTRAGPPTAVGTDANLGGRETDDDTEHRTMTSKTVNVPGISCGHCVATIERELRELEGVASVKAEQQSRRVTVSWDPEVTSWDAIEALMAEINYAPDS
jgi:copper chaperone CopZ